MKIGVRALPKYARVAARNRSACEVAPSGLATRTSPCSNSGSRSITRRSRKTASRTCRNGIDVSPRPPSTRAFHASESQVLRNMNSGGYSHQPENIAAKRTMTDLNSWRYCSSISSPIRLVRA